VYLSIDIVFIIETARNKSLHIVLVSNAFLMVLFQYLNELVLFFEVGGVNAFHNAEFSPLK
jgi:hypothetical protein